MSRPHAPPPLPVRRPPRKLCGDEKLAHQNIPVVSRFMLGQRADISQRVHKIEGLPQDLQQDLRNHVKRYMDLVNELKAEGIPICNRNAAEEWMQRFVMKRTDIDRDVNSAIMKYCDELGSACETHGRDICQKERTGFFGRKKCVVRRQKL